MPIEACANPLTIKAFSPYGSIISPGEEVAKLDQSAKNANQGTAIKLLQVSKVQNPAPVSCPPNWNLFRCFPKPHLQARFKATQSSRKVQHSINVLEMHPHSSQTFLPMGRPEDEISYLVVVALEYKTTAKPDLSTLKAFLCRGNQAVTYGAGIWHAPMIVLGQQEYVDFGVLIYEFLDEHAPEKDCVETHYADSEITIELFID
ncbi:hypothetical protein HG535_0H02940 [Zygotorulaspora mrakii]|uniref:Ureidoglycolate lyase n=1 Tax=Zygotorulaspora mrakii TaxID=42260 RepID=A0A7H9B8M5_ZYGMR|nr:uncharacterized protein HG535_0H02940 [Zygotorulaspora mrakii]QLG74967.1 hypothetical protein HG535_0H02940 [Zygotorulaspora mrakii]